MFPMDTPYPQNLDREERIRQTGSCFKDNRQTIIELADFFKLFGTHPASRFFTLGATELCGEIASMLGMERSAVPTS